MEQSLSFGMSISDELSILGNRILSMLPQFYANYDREIFMHMLRGRSYEAVILDGWWGLKVILNI